MTLRLTRPRALRSRRSFAAAGLLALATTAAATVLPATNAFAHGGAIMPGTRTYLCYQDGRSTGGDLQPHNPACAHAVEVGGKQPLWDWFGVLRGDAGGRTTGYIPDGQLCSGGNTKYGAYDEARADWPTTRLTSGAKFTWHYNAWAPHPGTFYLYVTKDGYDPTKPLKWSDLEEQPFSTWKEATPNGNGEYYWDVTLPANKTGQHIIYSRWVRSDSQENFFNCSDVVFDGGNGQVITPSGGSSGGAGSTTSTPTTTSTTTPTSPAPTTATPTDPPSTTSPTTSQSTAMPSGHDHGTPGDQGCTAQVNVKAWPGGYIGTVTVMNRGAAQQPWNVGFTVPAGVRLFAGWNADVKAIGTRVSAEAPAWKRSLASGAEVSVGFVAAGPSNPAPSGVMLNGTACGSSGSAQPTPSATTSSPAPATSTTTSAAPAPSQSSSSEPAPVTSTSTTAPAPTSTGGTTNAAFSDGFESQTGGSPSGIWTASSKDCSGTGKATIDTTVSHSGGKSLRIDGGEGYCNHIFVAPAQDLSAMGKDIYARMYIRHTTAQPAGHTTFLAMKDTSQGGKDLRIGGQNSALQWNRETDDATLPAQSPAGVAQSTALPTGTWQCLEIEVNGANGTAHTWLNGTEVKGLTADGVPTTDIDGQWYAGKTWRPAITDLRLGWESYGGGADTLWYDDVAIGTSRIGC
ncbi:MAG TPA: lytic polysaccharide monooxygenase [Kineosporiaceae bacterium]|nr:lytic polysaccharide monooxygenase [Kineosporiaceae bacterium]